MHWLFELCILEPHEIVIVFGSDLLILASLVFSECESFEEYWSTREFEHLHDWIDIGVDLHDTISQELIEPREYDRIVESGVSEPTRELSLMEHIELMIVSEIFQ